MVEALRSAPPATGDLETNAMRFTAAYMREYLIALPVRGVDERHGQITIAHAHKTVLAIHRGKYPQ